MKPGQIAQLIFIVVASVGVFSFVKAAQSDSKLSGCQAMCQMAPSYAGRNRTVPDFTLPNWDGEQVKFSELSDGKPVVLNFWTKTCKPCLEEMPSLAKMRPIVQKRGVKVITICTDEGPDDVRDTLEVLLEGKEPPFEILFDPDTTVVADIFGTSLYPETWLIDQSGVIRVRVDGARNWSSAISLEVIENITKPASCPVDFESGLPKGKHAGLCGDLFQ